jgi:hypothetical protein
MTLGRLYELSIISTRLCYIFSASVAKSRISSVAKGKPTKQQGSGWKTVRYNKYLRFFFAGTPETTK